MFNKLFLLSASLLCCGLSLCQDKGMVKDSLVKFSELQFSCESEKLAFQKINEHDNYVYFDLALYAGLKIPANETQWYHSLYEKLLKDIQNADFNKLKSPKQIKVIYSKVHDELLKKYELTTSFENLFVNGNYNCVTATMLYGLLLEYFKIPYEIKETTEHVFIIAKSDDKSILLESTDPSKGYLSYNQSFKDEFIKYLKEQKIINQNDIRELGTDSIFKKYYFSDININLQQLAGLQYYNNAVEKLEDEDFSNTLIQLQKSYFLYPSEKNRYLIRLTLASLLMNATYLEESDWKYFVNISRLTGGTITKESLKEEFMRLTQKVLVDKSLVDKYNAAYTFIYNNLTDSALKADISFVFNSQMSRYYILTNKQKKALGYVEAAYKLNPDNFEIQGLFFNMLLQNIDMFDEDEGIAKLEEYYNTYDYIRNNSTVFFTLAEYYLYNAKTYFWAENWSACDEYLQKFEKIIETNSTNKYKSPSIEDVYTDVAAYYFKIGNKKKAREYLLRGLKIDPENKRFKDSIEMLK